MRFIRVAIIANWKLYPIPRDKDVKYRPYTQFLKVVTATSHLLIITITNWYLKQNPGVKVQFYKIL